MTAVLVIGGLDSSGGAGLSRDIRTLTELGVEALAVATAVTAQTNSEVVAVHHVPACIISAQIRSALATRQISAIKIGMLGTAMSVRVVADGLLAQRNRTPIILDPVLAASSGSVLLDSEGREVLCKQLFPLATLVTPNLLEAAALLDLDSHPDSHPDTTVDEDRVIALAHQLLALGPSAVLIKGGHGVGNQSVDYLVSRWGTVQRFALPRVDTTLRGTGCALASAIAAGVASEATLEKACYDAKRYVQGLLSSRLARNLQNCV